MSTLNLTDTTIAFCEDCDNIVPTETVGNDPFTATEVCAYCGEEV